MLTNCNNNPQGCTCRISLQDVYNLIGDITKQYEKHPDLFKISHKIASEINVQLKSHNNIAILLSVMFLLTHEVAHRVENGMNNMYINPN